MQEHHFRCEPSRRVIAHPRAITRGLGLSAVSVTLAASLLSACKPSPQQVADGDDPLAALRSSIASTRYTDGYWREQARADSAGRWAKAVTYCGDVGRPRPGIEADGAKPNCAAVYGAEFALATHRAVEAAGKRLDEFNARNRETPQEAAARRQGKAPVAEAWRF